MIYVAWLLVASATGVAARSRSAVDSQSLRTAARSGSNPSGLLLEQLLAEHGPTLVGSQHGAASRLRGGSGMAAPTAGAMPSAATAKPKGYRMGDEDKPAAKVFVLPNLLTAEEATSADSSVVTLHPKKAEELGLMAGDTVRLKGKRDRETLCALQVSEKVGKGAVQLSAVTRTNLRLSLGDALKLYQCDSVKHGTSIKVLPFSDTMAGLTNEELKEQLVRTSPHTCYLPAACSPQPRLRTAVVPPEPCHPPPPPPALPPPILGWGGMTRSIGDWGGDAAPSPAQRGPSPRAMEGCAGLARVVTLTLTLTLTRWSRTSRGPMAPRRRTAP